MGASFAKRDCLIVKRRRLATAALPFQHASQVDIGDGELGIQLDRTAIRMLRFVSQTILATAMPLRAGPKQLHSVAVTAQPDERSFRHPQVAWRYPPPVLG